MKVGDRKIFVVNKVLGHSSEIFPSFMGLMAYVVKKTPCGKINSMGTIRCSTRVSNWLRPN